MMKVVGLLLKTSEVKKEKQFEFCVNKAVY